VPSGPAAPPSAFPSKFKDVRLSGRIDYAIRAAVELAARGEVVKLDDIAEAQSLPTEYVRSAMRDLRRSGIVASRRGHDGGYLLAKDAGSISLADIIRSVDGPLTEVRGERPDVVRYTGAATPLKDVWLALRASERLILEAVSLRDVTSGHLPDAVTNVLDANRQLPETDPAAPETIASDRIP
jgi:Rrf2 family protein